MKIIPIRLSISYAYLVVGDRPILVDMGSPGELERIYRVLRREGVEFSDLALILHTHGHIDHCGSSAALRRICHVPMAIQALDAPLLRAGINGPLRSPNPLINYLTSVASRGYAGLEPDIVINEEQSLEPYGIDGRIMFTPGHTSGSLSLLLASGEALIGDVLMGGYLLGLVRPYVPQYHYIINDQAALHVSIKRILEAQPTRLYLGHGGPLDPAAVRQRFAAALAD